MREGLVPTLLGTGVTAAAVAMRMKDMQKRGMKRGTAVPMAQSVLLGFGLAHVVLGAIDLYQDKSKY